MKLELNDKEVALLIGFINVTKGESLQGVFDELVGYAVKNNADILPIATIIAELLNKKMKFNPDEDDIYDEAILAWNKEEGLIP